MPTVGEVAEFGDTGIEEGIKDLITRLRAFFGAGMFFVFTDASREGKMVGNLFHLSAGDVSERMEIHHPELTVPQDSASKVARAFLDRIERFKREETDRGVFFPSSVILVFARPTVAQAIAEANFASKPEDSVPDGCVARIGGDRHITSAYPPFETTTLSWGQARVVGHRGTMIELLPHLARVRGSAFG